MYVDNIVRSLARAIRESKAHKPFSYFVSAETTCLKSIYARPSWKNRIPLDLPTFLLFEIPSRYDHLIETIRQLIKLMKEVRTEEIESSTLPIYMGDIFSLVISYLWILGGRKKDLLSATFLPRYRASGQSVQANCYETCATKEVFLSDSVANGTFLYSTSATGWHIIVWSFSVLIFGISWQV